MKLKPTPEQKLIIKHLRGHAMVMAGPGCAKTSTLALRVKHMLDQGHEPRSIVILTYGKALALDISDTLSKLVGTVAQQVTVATIHSFAYRLLRTDYQLLEYDEVPTVAKEQEKKRFINRYAEDNGLSQAQLYKAFSLYDLGKSSVVVSILGKSKAALARSAYKDYSNDRMRKNTVDFNDMINGAKKLLMARPDSALRRYKHLMVDELQDIDRKQKELLLELARRMESTVMVGDPLQSIFGWRHALPRYWHDIEKAIDPQKFELTRSFRIPRQALPLVNDLGGRIDEDTPVLTSNFEGEAPKLVEFVDQDQQYQYIAKEIKRLLACGVDVSQIVILGKTRKELGQTALALRARKITVTEHYRLKDNNRHKIHLLALIQLTRLEQLRLGCSSKALGMVELDQARTHIENLWLPRKLRKLLQKRLIIKPTAALLSVKAKSSAYDRVHDLSKAVRKAAGLNVESAVQCLIDASKPVLKDKDDRNHKLRLRDLAEIKIKSRNCMTLDDIEDQWFKPSILADKGLQVLTCHGAKGQEWDYVFILNVVQGVFPRHQPTIAKAREENRVFYVAVTRHHKGLYLLQAPTPTRIVTVKRPGSSARSCAMKPVIFDEGSSFIDIKGQGLVYKCWA